MNTSIRKLVALSLATLVLGSCQTRDAGPTQPASDSEVELAARLVATKAPPNAQRVRLRLSIGNDLGKWIDTVYVSKAEILLGSVQRGTKISLDIRAYSFGASNTDTLWKWFARADQNADSAAAIQVIEAEIKTIPTAQEITSGGTSPNKVALPVGSFYTLDGTDPKKGSVATGGEIEVPMGKTLRAILRIVVPGINDTLWGDTLSVTVADTTKIVPVLPPKRPAFSSEGATLPSQLTVGSSILIKADSGAKLAYTTDESDPKCSDALEENEYAIKIGVGWADQTIVLKAVSCRGKDSSEVERAEVRVLKVGEIARQEVGIPEGFDSTGTLKTGWKESVGLLNIREKSTVLWNMVVRTGVVTTNMWPAFPTADSKSGTALNVDSALLKGVSATDSLATVLVVALLSDSVGNIQDTAYLRWIIRVPYAPPMPKSPGITVNDHTLLAQHSVGEIIVVKADSASKLAYTTDSSAPDCKSAKDSIVKIKIDSTRAGKTFTIRALSCRDALVSEETTGSVRVAKLDEIVKELISIPAPYQWNKPTAVHVWTESVVLPTINAKSRLVWNLRMLPLDSTVTEDDWKAVGIPDTSSSTGKGNRVGVSKNVLASMPVKDSAAIMLAVMVLYDSTMKVSDVARMSWNIVVPVTPKPRLSVARYPDRLVFSWPVTDTTADARIWYVLGKDTVHPSNFEKGASFDSFTVIASKGARVKAGVVSLNSATGRASELAVLDTVATLAPRVPGFSVVNFDTLAGRVEFVLDDTTLAEDNTVWMAGYSADEASISIDAYHKPFVAGRCTVVVNTAGGRDFGVRATRDGMDVESVNKRLTVKRTMANAPRSVQDLKVLRKDSSSVVWSWTKSGERKYRVLVLRGKAMATNTDTMDCKDADKLDVGNIDLFEVKDLAYGSTVSLAVVALAGNDSAGGNAEPAFSVAKTLIPPPKPEFTVVNTNRATGEVTVTIDNWADAGISWHVDFDSTGKGAFDARNNYVTKDVAKRNFAVNGTVSVRVRALRDGYTSFTVKSIPVKNTNLIAPAPPSGISWTRTTNSVTLTWDEAANHAYRLFWDFSTDASNIDTSDASTSRLSAPSNPYTFTVSPGSRVRIALQTMSATDSTKPSELSYASQSSKATIDPVQSVTTTLNPDTRKVTFKWAAVGNAKGYRYSSDLETGIKTTASTSVDLEYPAGVTDIDFSVQAENDDGELSSWATSTFHIPQNRGSTNLSEWDIWTTGTNLTIQGKPSTFNPAPDSVLIFVYNNYSKRFERFRFPYTRLNGSTVVSTTLDESAMNQYGYDVQAQYLWTSGSLKGDTTDIDVVPVRGWAGPTPVVNYTIEDGRMKVGINKGNLSGVARTGWTIHVFANYKGSWRDIANDLEKPTDPNIAVDGIGYCPLGASELKIFSDSTSNGVTNTSIERIVPILPDDSILHEGHYYPIVMFGAKRWITRPMNTRTTANKCADKTTSADCGTLGRLYTWLEATKLSVIPDSGEFEIQGVCPRGWRIPKSSEIVELTKIVDPGWAWVDPQNVPHPHPDTDEKLVDAGFELKGSSLSDPANAWEGPGMWAATTGAAVQEYSDMYYKQQDLWYVADWAGETIYTAYSRSKDSKQIAMAFCIEQ